MVWLGFLMTIASVDEALKILNEYSRGERERVKAIYYLTNNNEERVIVRLVKALQDDDFGIRWVASRNLAKLGPIVLPTLLNTLTDKDRVGDLRLRRSAVRVLKRMKLPYLPKSIEKLIETLEGPAAADATMNEAHKVLADVTVQALSNVKEVADQ